MRDTFDMPAPHPDTDPGGFRLTGTHVLAALIAFFGVVFAVNGFFLVRALATHTGVVAVEPYRKGLAYNERIVADEQQAALGWTDTAQFNGPETLSVMLQDRSGAPVTGALVHAQIGRPSTSTDDRALEMREAAAGSYAAQTTALAPGAWLVTLEVRTSQSPDAPVYRAKRRLWLNP